MQFRYFKDPCYPCGWINNGVQVQYKILEKIWKELRSKVPLHIPDCGNGGGGSDGGSGEGVAVVEDEQHAMFESCNNGTPE